MATIPQLRRQVAQQALPNVQVRPSMVDNSGIAQGLADVANTTFQIQQRQREQADTTAVIEADNRLTEWQNSALYDNDNGVFTRKGKNALNVTNSTLEAYDKQQADIAAGLANEQQRRRFSELATRRRQGVSQDLNRYEYGEHQRYMDDVDGASIALSADSAALNYNDPAKVGQYRQKALAVLQSQADRKGWSDEELQLQSLNTSSKILTGVLGRMVGESPTKAREYLNASRDGMTADDQSRVETAIEREQKQREIEARQLQAIARAEMGSRLGDASSAYLAGLDYADPPSRAQLIGAYGAEEGNQRYSQLQKLQGVSVDLRELATAAPEERAQIIARYSPAQDGLAKAGYREDAQVYGVLTTAASRILKAQQDDPAAFVSTYSPAVRAAAEAFEAGGSAEDYAAAVLAEQQRLGVAAPRLLSNQQAAQIAARFQQTEDGGANSAKLISDLQQQWGKSYPLVFKQLQNELPGAAMVIGTGLDENTAATLARIAPLKTEELKRGLDSGAGRNVRESLNERFADFRTTLAGQVGGDRTFATMYQEAERLSLHLMGTGVSAKDATERAFKSMVDDKYTIRGTWRAPKDLDADLIERGASIAQQSIDPKALMFAVPKGVSEEFAAERVKAAIDSAGQWVTLPDESGLALYYGGEAVLDKEGNPVTRSWDDLTGTAVENPGLWERFNQGRQSLRDAGTQGQRRMP